MPRQKENLSKNEWQLMDVLWKSNCPLALSEIISKLEGSVSWAYSTYQTQLERLVRSGYVGYEKHGRVRLFFPILGMEECVLEERESIRDRLTAEAARHLLVSMLSEAGKIRPDEAQAISHLIDVLEKGEKHGD